MANKKKASNEQQANVAEALSKTEVFFNKNKKRISYGIIAVIVIAAICFAYHSFVTVPGQKKAQNQMVAAERYFRLDSFNLALNGDGNALGFTQVIDNFGSKAPKSVYMYAGISALQMGDNDAAIKFLKKYSGKNKLMLARAKACIGDAYANKGEYGTAAGYFKEAAGMNENVLAARYLLKAGLCYEQLGQYKQAIEAYQKIKDLYSQSPEGADIDKYITRAQTFAASNN